MKRQEIRKLIDKFGYTTAKRKMRIKGFSKKEILEFTDFLFN